MKESPDKRFFTRRNLLSGTLAATAASAVPEIALSPEAFAGSAIETWRPVVLPGGQIVRLNTVSHTPENFAHDYSFLDKRIAASEIVIIEGTANHTIDLSDIAQKDSLTEKEIVLAVVDREAARKSDGAGYMAGIASLALLRGRRTYVIDTDSKIAEEAHLVSIFAGLTHFLTMTEKRWIPGESVLDAATVDMLSQFKSSLELASRYYSSSLLNEVKEYDNKDLIRIAWDLQDWRDASVAQAIHKLPFQLHGTWREGQLGEIFRGAAHGSSLHHYLQSPNEATAKRALYPHWEAINAFVGQPVSYQLTKAGRIAVNS